MISKSALMTDPYLLFQEYERIKEENANLIQMIKAKDIGGKKILKNMEDDKKKHDELVKKLEEIIQNQADKIAKILFVVDLYKSKINEIDPDFEIPVHVIKFLT